MEKTEGGKGFTLIELLVVISIIGVLSTIALTSLNAARTKAREAKMQTTLGEIEKAAHLDSATYGTWSADVGPSKCTAACAAGASYPRFVVDGVYAPAAYNDNKWYCPTCCYDYQNWESGNWISLDVYQYNATCGVAILKRKCIYDGPGGATCANK